MHKKSWKNLPHHSNYHQHQASVWYIRAIDREACRIDDVMVEKFLLLRGVTLFLFGNARERGVELCLMGLVMNFRVEEPLTISLFLEKVKGWIWVDLERGLINRKLV
jgi:hypothetical protein